MLLTCQYQCDGFKSYVISINQSNVQLVFRAGKHFCLYPAGVDQDAVTLSAKMRIGNGSDEMALKLGVTEEGIHSLVEKDVAGATLPPPRSNGF